MILIYKVKSIQLPILQRIIKMSTETKIIGGITLITIAILVGGIFFLSKQTSEEASVPEDQVVSRQGIHWHPKLTISIKGKKQEIPANVGIGGAIHQPVHTHDSSGTLHLEVSGLVTKDETKLGNFFRIWGKQFNSNCIFAKCGSQEGKVKMTVNGQENKEFENYQMKDGDNIEIKYE